MEETFGLSQKFAGIVGVDIEMGVASAFIADG